jgi:acylphosphatase
VKRAVVLIYGKVQGVGYRFWTLKTANELGLHGTVKNLEDGRVEAIFEGDEDSIKHMLTKALKGPNLADVYNIDVEWDDVSSHFTDFTIIG